MLFLLLGSLCLLPTAILSIVSIARYDKRTKVISIIPLVVSLSLGTMVIAGLPVRYLRAVREDEGYNEEGTPALLIAKSSPFSCWIDTGDYRRCFDEDALVYNILKDAKYERSYQGHIAAKDEKYFVYYIPYDDYACCYVFETGDVIVVYAPDLFAKKRTYYSKMDPMIAEKALLASDRVVQKAQRKHDEAYEKAALEGDLDHFLARFETVQNVNVSHVVGYDTTVLKDDGSIFEAIKSARYQAVSLDGVEYEYFMAFNEPTSGDSEVKGWSYHISSGCTVFITYDFDNGYGEQDRMYFGYLINTVDCANIKKVLEQLLNSQA